MEQIKREAETKRFLFELNPNLGFIQSTYVNVVGRKLLPLTFLACVHNHALSVGMNEYILVRESAYAFVSIYVCIMAWRGYVFYAACIIITCEFIKNK